MKAMDNLSAIDAAFLYAETPHTPMHVAALQFYDPATAPNGCVPIERIIDNVRRRAHRIDCFHRKLLETKWQLDHPRWIDDVDFDPAQHVFKVSIPTPGDWRALCETVARLNAEPLDRTRPLWEMHVLTGLDDIDSLPPGAFAILTKIHHAAVDGVAGIGVTAALHDLEPTGTQPEARDPLTEKVPTQLDLIAGAMCKAVGRPLRVLNAWPALARLASAAYATPPIAIAPRTRFNRRVSGQRTFDAIRVPLAGLKASQALVDGATINDVVLSIVGGALRRYLDSHDELPRRTLTAMVPISTRKEITHISEGNQISQMIVGLGTDLGNARDRLQAVQRASARAKPAANRVDAATLATLTELPPAPLAAFAIKTLTRQPGNPAFNTVVTNVKGPPVPFYTCGAKLVGAYGTGPITDGLGIIHTALSYYGELTLSVLACPKLMPDVEFYVDCLRAGYEELVAIATDSAVVQSRAI
jgi:WS/DGAT/MGAT family acyltransferase